jgi:hypothetical protein
MNSHTPQFSLLPLKFSFLPCLASLVLCMCESNVMHRVAILMSCNTAELGLVNWKVWRFKSSGMWCCVTLWVISAAHRTCLPSSTVLKSPKTSSAVALLWVWLDESHFFSFQHANEDVEKMILGNKNDMEEKRVVSGGSCEYCDREFIQYNSCTVRLCRLTIVTFTVFLSLPPAPLSSMFEGSCIMEYISIIVRQDATIYSLFIFVNCFTCFDWWLHSSSGAHITVSVVSGIIETVLLPVWLRTAVPSQTCSRQVAVKGQ